MTSKLVVLTFLILFSNNSFSKSVFGTKHEQKSQSDIDKEILLDDPEDYPDDDVLDLPPEVQKERLKKLVETKIDADKDGFVDSDELYQWTLKAYNHFEVEDLRDEIQIVDEDRDGSVSWKEHCTDVFGAECAEKDDCFVDPQTSEDIQNAFNYNKDKELFAASDTNKDSLLDFPEYVIFKHPRRSEITSKVVVATKLEQLDSNSDGALDLKEFLKDTQDQTTDENTHKMEEERFTDELDVDGNGKLDEKEILDWLEPNNEAEAHDEADHLMSECDSDDNSRLSVEEILNNHNIWVDSDATDYGRYLLDHDEL